uniref:COHA1 n=1 Tax=Anisakis simplex TaxID=6269 RepID=A0A0M3JKS2_ANISI
LRRRFSAQRQSNLSTSSSGTTGTGTGTGTGCMNTACSSTDSSMDAGSIFAVGGSVGVTPPAPGWSTNSQGLLISGGATADYGSQSGVAATTGSSGGSDSHLAGSTSGMGALGSTMKRSAGSTSSVGKDGVVATAGNTSSTAMTSGTSATQLPRFV